MSQADLKNKYEKYDVAMAKKLMAAAGQSKGFSIKLSTFSTPLDFQAVAALIQNDLKQINVDVEIVAQDPATFAANNGKGNFEMDLTARGMRGDVDGYVAEFNPSGALGKTVYQTWFGNYKNVKMFRLVGNGRIQLDAKKRLPMYKQLEQILFDESLEIGLVAVSKYQVVNAKLQDMYVSFTDSNPGLVRQAWIG